MCQLHKKQQAKVNRKYNGELADHWGYKLRPQFHSLVFLLLRGYHLTSGKMEDCRFPKPFMVQEDFNLMTFQILLAYHPVFFILETKIFHRFNSSFQTSAYKGIKKQSRREEIVITCVFIIHNVSICRHVLHCLQLMLQLLNLRRRVGMPVNTWASLRAWLRKDYKLQERCWGGGGAIYYFLFSEGGTELQRSLIRWQDEARILCHTCLLQSFRQICSVQIPIYSTFLLS